MLLDLAIELLFFSIWHLFVFVLRFQLCLDLYHFYRECYDETQKEMIAAPDERPFDCSEMYVFGKFETFKKRLIKVGTCWFV